MSRRDEDQQFNVDINNYNIIKNSHDNLIWKIMNRALKTNLKRVPDDRRFMIEIRCEARRPLIQIVPDPKIEMNSGAEIESNK